MTDQPARLLFSRGAMARAVVAVLLVLGGLVAPQVATVPAHAGPSASSSAARADDDLRSELRADLEAHLQVRGVADHISAAAMSVSLAEHESSIDVSAGTMTFGGSEPVLPSSVWQIGSNTKAFTSVLLLQLEAEGRLSIDDTLARWLPEYPQWQDVPIRRLLNMTSGIATYDMRAAFRDDYAADPLTHFSATRLVGYVEGPRSRPATATRTRTTCSRR
jgi:D-alanyl-D-alanine carboxypeptidase